MQSEHDVRWSPNVAAGITATQFMDSYSFFDFGSLPTHAHTLICGRLCHIADVCLSSTPTSPGPFSHLHYLDERNSEQKKETRRWSKK